ncbi:MAG TPA: hypothetical protein VFQ57_00355 [Sphingomonas sp.]|nr:hypothetical protein [Sphingomonas sp.]
MAEPPVAGQAVSLKFQIGARTLGAITRHLVLIPYSLDEMLAQARLDMPPLPEGADGYLVTSLPETMLAAVDGTNLLTFVRRRYTRYHVDLAAGETAWLAGLSGSARSGIKRKAKKLAFANGGTLDIRSYHDAEAFAVFHPLARAISARTYQERLLGSGLPEDMESVRRLESLATQEGAAQATVLDRRNGLRRRAVAAYDAGDPRGGGGVADVR